MSAFLVLEPALVPTNCADDAGTAVVLLRCIVNVETGVPLHLGSVVQMVKRITHLDGVDKVARVVVTISLI